MNIKKYILALFIPVALCSCDKYLDVKPKGKLIPKTLQDFDEMGGHPTLLSAGNAYAEQMTDDYYMTDDRLVSTITSRTGKSYLWMKDLLRQEDDDSEWNGPYKNIYTLNLILQEIEKLPEDAQGDRKRIRGEALLNRAFAYWTLVNLYAKDYNAATAATDEGVPLSLATDLEAALPRSSVAAVYDLILKDVTAAITLLPSTSKNVYRVNKIGAYALAARVHLSMKNYKDAYKNASLALAEKSNLLDFNTYSFKVPAKPFSGINNRPLNIDNPENVLYRTSNFSTIVNNSLINPDLLAVLGEKDLRYVFSYTRLDRLGAPSPEPFPLFLNQEMNYSIGVPELMLIKAECAARDGNKEEAVQLLNTLRKKRFRPADYEDLTAATPEVALTLTIAERRRELVFKGLRWFDLKRLNQEDRFKKTLQRIYKGETYTLEPGSPRYVLPIAPKILLLNPNITQNPR